MSENGIDPVRPKAGNDLRSAIRDRIRSLRNQLQQQRGDVQKQRRSVRRPFAHVQRIAPYDATRPNQSLAFYDVMCRDISTSGFSFQTSSAPQFPQLVVELGVAPDALYLMARVVRIAEQPDKSFIVGCEFMGRHS